MLTCHGIIVFIISSETLNMFDFSESEDSDFDEVVDSPVVAQTAVKVTGKKHMNQIRDILDLTAYQKKKQKKIRKRKEAKARKLGMGGGLVIQTLASKVKGADAPEMVTFVDHKNRKKAKDKGPSENIPINIHDNRKEVTMKQARFEVFQLGVSAMDKKSRVDANTALAIRLGAKPAKNEVMEYSKLKEERAKDKEEHKQKLEDDRNALQGMKQKKKSTKEKGTSKSKAKKGSGQMKVGSFDGGMLKLSSKDLARLKAK